MTKTHVELNLDSDLMDFMNLYVQEHRTTFSDVITQFLRSLKRRTEGDSTELILSHPDFHHAILDVQARLRDGSAEWHSFDEVFGEA